MIYRISSQMVYIILSEVSTQSGVILDMGATIKEGINNSE